MTRKVLLLSLLIGFLLADVGYSFLQHYHTPFDGDMAGGIVPAEDVIPILENPLGFQAFKEHVTYPNPNRFFCHWSFYKYFNSVPQFIQNFTTPINSAYISSALAKTIIQIVIIYILAFAISGSHKIKLNFLLSAVLVTPLFQTNGYVRSMGIIDPSTTYTFFYALPIVILLIYFIPLFIKNFYGIEIKTLRYFKIFWIPLALMVSLSGPLNPGISLIISLLLFSQRIYLNFKNSQKLNIVSKIKLALKEIPKDYYFFLFPICFFSIYSLILGRYNSINLSNEISLLTLYSKLPQGIYYSFTQKLGFPVLFTILIINSLIINKKFHNHEGKQILKLFKWIGIFSLLYIALLPLGGYRDYRPYLLRYDTIIPITLSLMFIFGKTTLYLLQNFSSRQRLWYVPIILLVLFVFVNSDEPMFDKNECEKSAIIQISQSNDSIVELNSDCTILSWIRIDNPQKSKLNSDLLKIWNINTDDKLYYQK